MQLFRYYREKILICLPGLILLLNAYYSIKVVAGHSVLSVKHFLSGFSLEQEQSRAFWVLAFLAAWMGILALLEAAKKSIRTIHPPSLLLAAAAIGMLVVLTMGRFGIYTMPRVERCLLCAPAIFVAALIFWRLRRRRADSGAEVPLAKVWARKEMKPVWLFLASLAVAALAVRMVEAWNALAWYRGKAAGDELHFWWSSADFLARSGFQVYWQSFSSADYYPAYPFISLFFTALAPVESIEPILFGVPFLFGILLWWSWFTALPAWPRRIRWGLGVVGVTALLQHDWVFSVFYSLWYGEALAVLVVWGLIQLLESEDPMDIFSFIQLFGLGVLSSLVKPPLSILAVLAFFPGYFLMKLCFDRELLKRKQSIKILVAFCGALIAQLVWNSSLQQAGKAAVYPLDSASLLNPVFHEGSFPKLMAYFFTYYKQYWLNYLLITLAILALRPRKYAAAFAVTSGLVFAVFFLYATQWKSFADYESGGRYILHGMVAWILFAAPRLFADQPAEA